MKVDRVNWDLEWHGANPNLEDSTASLEGPGFKVNQVAHLTSQADLLAKAIGTCISAKA